MGGEIQKGRVMVKRVEPFFIVSQKQRRESRYASGPGPEDVCSRTKRGNGIIGIKRPASRRKSPYFIESKTDTSKFTKKTKKRRIKKLTEYIMLNFLIEMILA
jgi:hypothetical protein